MSDHDRRQPLTMEEIERSLQSLNATLELPPFPDLAPGVLSGIAEQRRDNLRAFPRSRTRQALTIAAAIVIALVAALTLSSGFRSAVADFFHVGGISITFSDDPLPTPTPTGTPSTGLRGESLLLGNPTTLAEAQAGLDFTPRTLPAEYGEPDEVFVRPIANHGPILSLLYYPTDLLPNTAETGVGVLLMEFRGDTPPGFIGKRIDGTIDWIQGLGDEEAAWIEDTHELTLISDPSFDCCTESRVAGSVLIWQSGGVTYRMESALSRDEAIALAKTITP